MNVENIELCESFNTKFILKLITLTCEILVQHNLV